MRMGRPARRLRDRRRRLNHDSARTRPERNTEWACRHREEARQKGAARDGGRKQERRDHSLQAFHTFPHCFGIGCLSLLPQPGVRTLLTLPLLTRSQQSLI